MTSRLAAPLAVLALAGCGGAEPDAAPTAAPATPLPDVARIVCGGEMTTVATARVRPQRDGVHLRLENRAGKPLAYSVLDARGGGQGADLPVDGAALVASLPPGRMSVACSDPASNEDPGEQERAALEVVDPSGLWTPAVVGPACERAVSAIVDYAAGAKGEQGTPVEVARRYLEQRSVLEDGDAVEPAGYPEQAETVVRLVRAGEPVAVLHLMDDGADGWLLGMVDACAGIGLG